MTKQEKIKIKLLFEDIESKIPNMYSKHFMTQGYICQEGVWWRYYTEWDYLAGKHYTLYNKDSEITTSNDLLYGKIYTLDFRRISKLKYIFNMCFRPWKQDSRTFEEMSIKKH